MDMFFMGSDLFNVGSGQDGQYGKTRKHQIEDKVKEQGQFNNFYSLQHLNYDRDCNEEDLDAATGQIKVMRGYRHPFDYSTNGINVSSREYFANMKGLLGEIYQSPEEVSTWTSSWPLLTFFSVWGLNQQLTPAGLWVFEYFGNYNFLQFGFLGKCFMLPWIMFNLFKPFYLGNWTHDLIKQELASFKRGINDMLIDATLEEKQKSLEQMQQLELLEFYPKLRAQFYHELKHREEILFKRNTTSRVNQVLEQVLKYERSNFSKVNNKVIDNALHTLETAVEDDAVQNASLDTAILKLRTVKKQDAEQVVDPLTEAVVKSLHKSRDEYNNLSVQEQNDLVKLTDAQKDRIKKLDERLRESQLKSKVEVHEDAILENPVQQEVQGKMNA